MRRLLSGINRKHGNALVVVVFLLLPLSLFLLHGVLGDSDCHMTSPDVCPCGLVSLTALVSLSFPLLNGHVLISPLSSTYVVSLSLLDPPPKLALLS